MTPEELARLKRELEHAKQDYEYWTAGGVGPSARSSITMEQLKARYQAARDAYDFGLREAAVSSLMTPPQIKAEQPVPPVKEEGARKVLARKVFIGHGRSLVWLQLKEFLNVRLRLTCDEFNAEAVAGIATTERLQTLLDDAGFAFLVMTAEDIHADASSHARENVIHEAGLFQGRLGFKRAIILLEDGCAQFSNIHGLSHIRFPKGNLEPVFEKVRQVLEREQVLR
jgi:predicted nucleotide-binding protein